MLRGCRLMLKLHCSAECLFFFWEDGKTYWNCVIPECGNYTRLTLTCIGLDREKFTTHLQLIKGIVSCCWPQSRLAERQELHLSMRINTYPRMWRIRFPYFPVLLLCSCPALGNSDTRSNPNILISCTQHAILAVFVVNFPVGSSFSTGCGGFMRTNSLC